LIDPLLICKTIYQATSAYGSEIANHRGDPVIEVSGLELVQQRRFAEI
jgi:hypothetical protein